jgi:hypothetical protein
MEEYYDEERLTLSIPSKYNKKLDIIHENTKVIIFKEDAQMRIYSEFNQTVDNLPNKIKHLIFGYKFNKEVNNLPKSLIILTFGNEFYQKIICPNS